MATGLGAASLVVAPQAIADSPSASAGKVFGISEPNTVGGAPGYPSPDGLASLISDLGAQSHRWEIDWRTVEAQAPQNGIHNYDFSSTDPLYAADLGHGIKPLIILTDAPQWAWSSNVPQDAQPFGMPPSPEHLDDWGAFAAAVAERYPQALGLEIWNEPDAWGWSGGVLPIDPLAYTQLLERAYGAIKSVNPAMPVIGGALAAYPTTEPGVHMSVNDFVGGMLRAGAANFMDGISVHLYAGGPTPPTYTDFDPPLDWLRSTLSQYGVSMPIWVTESGVSTTGPGAVTEQGQAQSLVDLYKWFQTQPDIKALFIHSLFERWTDPSSPEAGFGLIHQGSPLDPKPAFYALQNATGEPPAIPGPNGVSEGSTVAAGNGPPVGGQILNLVASIPPAQPVMRSGNLRVMVDCQGPCAVRAQGRLKLRERGGAILYRLDAARATSTGGPTTLQLQLQRGLHKVLPNSHEPLRARVKVFAQGTNGAVANRILHASLN